MLRLASSIALLVVAALLGGEVRADVGAEASATCRRELTRELALFHADVKPTDIPDACGRLADEVRAGLPRARWPRRIRQARDEILFAFAPKNARHSPSARYRLPFVAWIPRLVSQGPGGPTHDTRAEHYAYDILMPRGAWVVAARGGTVAAVRDGSDARRVEERGGDRGNSVEILHDDGTFALYAHLEPGIPVKAGQPIRRGERLGRAGNTGFAKIPHLHFVVRSRAESGLVSHALRFGRPGTPGYELEAGKHVGNRPKGRRALRVRVDGTPVGESRPVPIPRGGSVRLQVTDAAGKDLTESDRTRYESMTLWNLHASAPGRVQASAADPAVAAFIEETLPDQNLGEAILFIYHGTPRDPDFGVFQLHFEVQQ